MSWKMKLVQCGLSFRLVDGVDEDRLRESSKKDDVVDLNPVMKRRYARGGALRVVKNSPFNDPDMSLVTFQRVSRQSEKET